MPLPNSYDTNIHFTYVQAMISRNKYRLRPEYSKKLHGDYWINDLSTWRHTWYMFVLYKGNINEVDLWVYDSKNNKQLAF